MSDDLYHGDPLAWAEREVNLLRRLADGEPVLAELDWPNLIEEIYAVGLSQLRAVSWPLARGMERLLQIHGWPNANVELWRNETLRYLSDANACVTPSVLQQLDVPDIYDRARALIAVFTVGGKAPRPLPEACPFAVEDLIIRGKAPPDVDVLLAKLAAVP